MKLEYDHAAWCARKRAAKPAGTCSNPSCVNTVEGNYKTCAFCRHRAIEYRNKHRAVPKREGQCGAPGCSYQARSGLAYCEKCATRISAYQKTAPYRAKDREVKRKLRDEVFRAYGGECFCCKESDFEFLSVDHIEGHNGIGPEKGGEHLYYWLKANDFPLGFRVLCMNCNTSLGRYGYCPHGDIVQQTAPRPRTSGWSPEKAERQRLYRIQCRKTVFQAYGGSVCNCCGETNLEFLSIDHLDNNGGQHRKTDRGARNIYRWLINNNFPDGFQVLCMNCNFAKRYTGKCPHEGTSIVLQEKPNDF